MKNSILSKCKIIKFPKVLDKRGNLTFLEEDKDIPFKIKRVFYTYGVPKEETRGSHAMKKSQEVIIAINGSFDVTLDDGMKKKKFHLNRPYSGLFTPPMIWQELTNFSSDSVCLVLVSKAYDDKEYIRSYAQFKKLKDKRK